MHNDDWVNVNNGVENWMSSDVVIFFQPYDPTNEDPGKRPFVLVIQTKWMRELALRITPGSAWALDSTFKTNQYGLPPYATMCPNSRGLGMPIFFMLCSSDVKSGQESMALKLTWKVVFDKMGSVRPNAIIIDKCMTEFNALKNVIDEDLWCWEISETCKVQTKCHILLCWFHIKKAWIENLLPKVSEVKKMALYKHMCELLECITEEAFTIKYEEFKITYIDERDVLNYVATGWTGIESQWRGMWPRYNRLYEHALDL